MKKLYSMLIAATLVTGCSTTGQPDSLQALQARYNNLENDRGVQRHAQPELVTTGDAVEQAKETWEKEGFDEPYLHHHYLANRHADLTEVTAENGALSERFKTAQSEQQKLSAAIRKSTESNDMVVTVEDVLFEFDKSALKTGAQERLEQLTNYLRSNPETQVVIEGHADATGDADYNMMLSEKRAKAVANHLKENGVDPSRIDMKAYGERKPVANNETRQGRQINRRAEIVLPNPVN